MSPPTSRAAAYNYTFWDSPLITIQHRLRHLRSITGRNVTYADNVLDSQLYFTLHLTQSSLPFYTSERVNGSLNPTWKGFSADDFAVQDLHLTSKTFVVRIYHVRNSQAYLCLNWEVHISALVSCGKSLEVDNAQFAPNSIIFGLHDSHFVVPQNHHQLPLKPQVQLTVPSDVHIRSSYSMQSLVRIQTILRVIKQTDALSDSARTEIITTLLKTHQLEEKRKLKERLEVKRVQLHKKKEISSAKLLHTKSSAETRSTANKERERELQKRWNEVELKSLDLQEKKQAYYSVREKLLKTGAQLVMRRKQLVADLALIYPIRLGSNGIHTIAGVELPQSEELQIRNETDIEVGLGYSCHLVAMISHFLDMPLRYPMQHRGSKSLISDYIIENVADKDREFPLFVKGREQFQCEYGVYLLNKNVAQLRFYCGMSTNDLRQTLGNLRALLQMKLGVKLDEHRMMALTPADGRSNSLSHSTNNSRNPSVSNNSSPKKRTDSQSQASKSPPFPNGSSGRDPGSDAGSPSKDQLIHPTKKNVDSDASSSDSYRRRLESFPSQVTDTDDVELAKDVLTAQEAI